MTEDKENRVGGVAAADLAHQWQPIDTAPKDADVLLLTDGNDVTVGGWISAADQGAEPEEEFRIAAGWWFLNASDMKPTHWMPLPAAPVVSASRQPQKEKEKDDKILARRKCTGCETDKAECDAWKWSGYAACCPDCKHPIPALRRAGHDEGQAQEE